VKIRIIKIGALDPPHFVIHLGPFRRRIDAHLQTCRHQDTVTRFQRHIRRCDDPGGPRLVPVRVGRRFRFVIGDSHQHFLAIGGYFETLDALRQLFRFAILQGPPAQCGGAVVIARQIGPREKIQAAAGSRGQGHISSRRQWQRHDPRFDAAQIDLHRRGDRCRARGRPHGGGIDFDPLDGENIIGCSAIVGGFRFRRRRRSRLFVVQLRGERRDLVRGEHHGVDVRTHGV
jgi:hypothetical protein